MPMLSEAMWPVTTRFFAIVGGEVIAWPCL